MGNDIPPFAILVSHRVANFDSWMKVFDDHKSARVEASCLGHHINRGADDPNMVYVYCPASDVDKATAFAESPELREIMKTAGVQGPATVRFITPRLADFIADEKLPGVIVTHAVEDYDTWRAAYDEFDDFRRESGIVGHAVNQEVGKPNQVIVYHQSNDMGSLRNFIDSTELKEAMERAGVAGEPDIHFVEVVDFAEY